MFNAAVVSHAVNIAVSCFTRSGLWCAPELARSVIVESLLAVKCDS
jgi:hypothetical protein